MHRAEGCSTCKTGYPVPHQFYVSKRKPWGYRVFAGGWLQALFRLVHSGHNSAQRAGRGSARCGQVCDPVSALVLCIACTRAMHKSGASFDFVPVLGFGFSCTRLIPKLSTSPISALSVQLDAQRCNFAPFQKG